MSDFNANNNDRCDMVMLKSTTENNDSVLVERLKKCAPGAITTKALVDMVNNNSLFEATRTSIQFEGQFLVILVKYCWRYNVDPKKFRFLCDWFGVPYTKESGPRQISDDEQISNFIINHRIWYPVGE